MRYLALLAVLLCTGCTATQQGSVGALEGASVTVAPGRRAATADERAYAAVTMNDYLSGQPAPTRAEISQVLAGSGGGAGATVCLRVHAASGGRLYMLTFDEAGKAIAIDESAAATAFCGDASMTYVPLPELVQGQG